VRSGLAPAGAARARVQPARSSFVQRAALIGGNRVEVHLPSTWEPPARAASTAAEVDDLGSDD
jgi:hypothetical protein